MRRLALLAGLAVTAACAMAPTIVFYGEDASVDAGPPPTLDAAANDAGAYDANATGDDAAASADLMDDAASDAAIACDGSTVPSCGQCTGAPLRCKRGGVDECVSDCESCGGATLPCFHCATPNAPPRGNCIAIGANGQIACSMNNLCGCSGPADCPVAAGAAQTCAVAPTVHPKRCLTCGAPTTADEPCVRDDGGSGTCRVGSGQPSCE